MKEDWKSIEEELNLIKRINKKMEGILLASGNDVNRLLEAAEMELTWTLILSKKLRRLKEIERKLILEGIKKEASRPGPRIVFTMPKSKIMS